MKETLRVEVCSPKFKDENNIHYIRLLDLSRSCNIDELIERDKDALADNKYGIYTSNIKVLNYTEIIDVSGKLDFDDAVICNYNEFEKIYNKLFHEKQINLDKYVRMINSSYDIFEVKVIPDVESKEKIMILVDGVLLNIPYDIFIILVVCTIECVNSENVKNFEIIPKYRDDRYISLKFKMTRKSITKKGYLNISVEPYICISGSKR